MAMATPIDTPYETPTRIPLEMVASVETVYLVRNLVDQGADLWGLSDNARFLGKLILTELATNAAKLYAGGLINAWIAHPRPGLVEVGVWDPDGGTMPKIIEADDLAVSGRGLFMIRELTGGRLGWYPSRRAGKVVWARFGP